MTPPTPNAKPKTAAISVTEVTQALMRHWVWVFIVAPAAATTAAAAVWFGLVIPKYSACSIFHVSARLPAVLSPTPESQIDFNTYRQAQATLLKSRLVLNAALEQKEVRALQLIRMQTDPAEWLESNIKVEWIGQEFLKVSIEGDEEASKVLIKAVTDVYLQEIVNKDRNSRLNRLEQLKAAYTRYEESLKKKRATVKELTVQMGSGDEKVIAMKQQFSQEQLQQSQRELLQIRSELRRLFLETAVLEARGKAGEDAGPNDALVNDELDQDPVIRQQRDRVRLLEETVDEIKRVAVPGSRPTALVRAQSELTSARDALDVSLKKSRPMAVARVKERIDRLQSTELQTIRHKLDLAKALEKSLSEEIEMLTNNAKSLNLGRVDLEAFNREINQTERITEQLAASIESLKVELDAPARVTLHENVTVTSIDQTRKRLKYAGYAAAGVIGLICSGVLGIESRRRRVTSSEEAAQQSGLELVGTVPLVHTQKRFWRKHDPSEQQTLLTEAVDATRVWFQHASRREGVQAIMVTSALSGEAKTSLSSHLSLSLARGGLNTLLIDGDMRRPSAHKALNLPPGKGLAELLRGDADADDLILRTDLYGLSFLPAGHWTPAATQQLSTETWPLILNDLKKRYDMIVIDSPPVLPVVDALLLGQQVDGVIMSVLQSVSLIGPLNEARQRLSQLGIRILGVVVSGVKSEYYHYRYYYNYTRALKQA